MSHEKPLKTVQDCATTVMELAREARESFAYQCKQGGESPSEATVAALNNALTPLSIDLALTREELAERREELASVRQQVMDLEREIVFERDAHAASTARTREELAELKSLGRRRAFSSMDPVCARCLALACEVENQASALASTPAAIGERCSRCGARVVERKDIADAVAESSSSAKSAKSANGRIA